MHEFTPNGGAVRVEMRSLPTVDNIQFHASEQLEAYTSHALGSNLKS